MANTDNLNNDNMKYLKPLSAVLLGRCGNNIWRTQTEDYTTTVVGTLVNENGTDEQLCGIYVTRSQLEQIRNEIDNYLQKTAESQPKLGIDESLRKPEATPVTSNFNVTEILGLPEEEMRKVLLKTAQRVTEIQGCQKKNAEQKQKLKVNPNLVRIEQSAEIPYKPYRASLSQWLNHNGYGFIELYTLGNSEEESRAALDVQFESLVLQCADTEVAKLETSSITSAKTNQDEVLLRLNKAAIVDALEHLKNKVSLSIITDGLIAFLADTKPDEHIQEYAKNDLEALTGKNTSEKDASLAICPKQQQNQISLEELVEKITPDNQYEETDWGRPVGQEIW